MAAAIGLAAGIYLGSFAGLPPAAWLVVVLIGVILARRSDLALLLALFALGGSMAPLQPSIVPQVPINPKRPVAFSATVEEVRERSTSVDHILRPLHGELSRYNIAKLLWRAAPSAYVDSDTLPRYEIGDTLNLIARLRRPHERRNPNGFRESTYLWTRHIDARTTGTVHVSQRRPASRMSWARRNDHFRQTLVVRMEEWVGPRSGLAKALLLGDRSGLDWEFMARVQSIGVAHVLAVSGLHAGFIAVFIATILRLLRVSPIIRALSTSGILVIYAGVTGAPASVIRAVIMISLYVLGLALGRTGRNWNMLGAAAMISLIIDPRSLFTPGFALSFSAVGGIFAFYQPMRDAWIKTAPGGWLQNRPGGNQIIGLMLLTFAAQLGSLPVTLALFHRLPLMGFLANLVIVPVAGFAIFALLTALVSSILLPPVAALFGHAAWGLLSVVEASIDQFASLGTPHIVTGRPPDIILVTLAVVVFMLPRMMRQGVPRATAKLVLSALVITNLVIWTGASAAQGLSVTVLDVGQGDAIHISTPGGRNILIDAGPRQQQWDAGRMIVVPYLLSKGITTLDLVIISHAHSDHAGGLAAVMESVNVRQIWHPPTPADNALYLLAIEGARLKGAILTTPPAGANMQLGNVSLDVLAPDSAMINNRLGANEGSLVVKLRYGNSSLLLTGDIESRAEYRLLSYGSALKSDWMKVAHHGGNTSSSARFLALVDPQGGVISVGARNRYSHPSVGAITRLETAGIPTLRTDQRGAVTLFSDGQSWSVTSMPGMR